MEGEDTLKEVPLFQNLRGEQRLKISRVTEEKSFEEGTTVIREGEKGDAIYILLGGRVEVSRTLTLPLARGASEELEKSFIRYDAQDCPAFGDMSLIDESPSSATVKTLTSCSFLMVPHIKLEALCEADSDLGYKLYRALARELAARLRRTNQDVLKLSTALSVALSKS